MHIKSIITRSLIIFSLAFSLKATAAPIDPGRQSISLNSDWQFYFTYNFEQNIKKEKVNLPHTWNAQETLKGVADYNRTSAIYENTLEVKPEWKGKRLFLYFEGVNSVATILVNNKFVGEHYGGYTGFCLEVTNYVKPGSNSITVQVSNAYRLDVIPLHGDFNLYGGIHRPASLIITDQDCITPLDYGSSGVYVSQKAVSDQSAEIEVSSKLSLKNGNGLSLKTTIYDQNKKIVSSSLSIISDVNTNEVKQPFKIIKPHLWNAKSDPYLYTAEVLLLKDNKVIDQISQPLGLRYFHVDPDKGFFLNGKYLDLYGVGRHEDVSGKGSALTNADHDNDMNLIKELGATAGRLTHYPQNRHFYDLCDQNGIVLWSEIPFVGPGGYTGAGYMKNPNLENNIRTMLIELIRQNYNHPSICFWGMFNELKLNYDDPQPFIRELNALAKKEDPSRLTTLASNLGANEFKDLTDLMGWNQYFGWYGGDFDEVGAWADEVHQTIPDKPISVSEYGAGASPFKHTEGLEKPSPKGRFHPEEWQTAFHEKHWAEFKKRPFIWGKFIWVLADFGSSIRTEGDHDAINDKGLVTYDRSIKKDAFYFYKANWNPEPMLYIAERRNTERTKPAASVKVFANVQNAELWVNGKEYGKKEKNDLNTILWENVLLKPGKNTILVKSKVKGKWLEDTCEWTLKQPAP
ncbi:glycoside hydrolase family 2 protein [Pedobacter frigoris]|uniref:Glycoside hydrolase family 2 protein n=1 Tax=Pedobacter frigoris TaxID=2571272 RepID=A0A4U1CJG4_9SPHI|nr:glycoside hydrolase family 2 TIM barrel-domain containing protein [Pedobacter frigoris]TKC07099.1 glycoside hydrolase family 2 protein [Pedobacter frigoris]